MRIFLIGFMGSGKTHWGRALAYNYNITFIDLDSFIEMREGKLIVNIFSEKGEQYFRKIETEALRSIAEENAIIACGGATPCFDSNMEWMNKHGITVYLKTTSKILADRLLKEKEIEKRPILVNSLSNTLDDIDDNKLENFIAQKLIEREPFYEQAQITLDAKNMTVESFKKIINY